MFYNFCIILYSWTVVIKEYVTKDNWKLKAIQLTTGNWCIEKKKRSANYLAGEDVPGKPNSMLKWMTDMYTHYEYTLIEEANSSKESNYFEFM